MNVGQFLDVEALVDDFDDEDEDDSVDDLIDDEIPVDNQAEYTPWTSFAGQDGNEGSWDDFLASLERRFSSDSRPARGTAAGPPTLENPLATHPAIASTMDNIYRLPRKDDYPLWRVRCKRGMENEIVFFLLQKSAPRHEITAAFAHPSVDGWVYLETTMNKKLTALLNLTPGIIRTRVGLKCQGIDHADGMKLLSSQPSGGAPQIGGWVEVRRGIYKGDVGFVTSANHEEVELLLVPRLSPPPAKGMVSR